MKILEFRIALREIEPTIWRRVQVRADCSFWELHCALQDAMGWRDAHLHAFRIAGSGEGGEVEIGIPYPDGLGSVRVLAGWKTRVDEYLSEEGDRALYLYDFGDGWKHDLELEKVLEGEEGAEYPSCIDGARACPPEDCGGSWRYGHILEVIADPDHEEYDNTMDWLGDEYDPEEFSPDDVNFLDPGMRLRSLLMSRNEVEKDEAGSILDRWLDPGVEFNRSPVLEENFESSEEYFRDGNSLKRVQPKVGRNDPCPCGSGKKYKKCCGK